MWRWHPILSAVFVWVLISAAVAEDERVDLELVLAVDISLSMDHEELQLQRDGYVEAFRHPDVIQAIKEGGYGKIAVTFVEWAGVLTPRVAVPWTLIEDRETSFAFARRLEEIHLTQAMRTSISAGLEFSARLFDDNNFDGLRRVIDVSGDGANNQGALVTTTRDRLVEQGIVINGLPVTLKLGRGPNNMLDIPDLDVYYEDCVIGGTGSFIVTVEGFERIAVGIRKKLILEIAGREPEVIPAQLRTHERETDCLIGEKLWQRFMERLWN